MITRKDHHNHFVFKERIRSFISVIINKLDLNHPSPTTKLKFETWKCDPLQKDMCTHFITVCNDELEDSLQGMSLLHGEVVTLDKVSETAYQVKFDDGHLYKLSRYF